jgi:hypothetical protein
MISDPTIGSKNDVVVVSASPGGTGGSIIIQRKNPVSVNGDNNRRSVTNPGYATTQNNWMTQSNTVDLSSSVNQSNYQS